MAGAPVRVPRCAARCTRRRWPLFLVAVLTAGAQLTEAQSEGLSERKAFTAYAEQVLAEARARYHQSPTNPEAAWQFGRACFERGEFATNDTERATIAVEGIESMRRLVGQQPKLAAGHYFLAMNLGQFARTKLLGALRIVDEMEREFKTARALDEHLEFAGPDRNLGQLYFQAPGWPASLGSRSKARRHLERAVELAPDYPGNRLNLLEACCEWKDTRGIRRELEAVEALWPSARTNFTGPAWASCWADWEKLRSDLKARSALLVK